MPSEVDRRKSSWTSFASRRSCKTNEGNEGSIYSREKKKLALGYLTPIVASQPAGLPSCFACVQLSH